MASAFGQLGDEVVTGRQLWLRIDAGHDLAGGVVAAAHSAGVRTLVRTKDSVATDCLETIE